MTIEMQQREQHQQQPRPQQDQRAQANRDLAREHGNQIAALADIAEEQLDETERELVGRTRCEDGLQVLRFLIGADWSERVLEADQVLHDEHGSLDPAKVVEFIDLLLAGQSSVQARQTLLARQPRRAGRVRATRSAVAAARQVSANLHHMAEAPKVQPALPAAEVQQPPKLPQRMPGAAAQRHPIAPALPPMFPPAPEPTEVEQTGQIVAALRANGHEISAEMEAAARKDHKSGLAVEPPDPAFAATVIPSARMGDTQRMVPVYEFDVEADGPAGEVEAEKARLPFAPAASTAASTSSPQQAGGSGGGDDD